MGVLLAAYQYELVCCFRCPRKGTQVTRIVGITSWDGETTLCACRECVQELLTMHERSMEQMDTRAARSTARTHQSPSRSPP
ncbi:hypothetical protein ACIP4S_28330 [Streptomyces chartreusis]|uniref:hypothetical protein n=1 Tax=Streptomyces chartreusis TaxID=1969 RepID=UPI0037FD10A1